MTNHDKVNKKQFKIGYGVKVPILSFEDTIQLLEKAGNSIGFDGSLDDLSRKAGNTPTSSTFKKKVATLKNYGLIGVAGGQFTLTELGQCIINPTSPEQRIEAILESFLNLNILRALFEKYKGKLLPERKFLGNFIHLGLDIPSILKLDWADYFIAAAEFSSILHKRENGNYQVMGKPSVLEIVQNNTEESLGEFQQEQEVYDTQRNNTATNLQPNHVTTQVGVIESSQWGILNQRKVSGNRKAVFAIPDDLSKEDIVAIKKILAGIEASLEGLLAYNIDEKEE